MNKNKITDIESIMGKSANPSDLVDEKNVKSDEPPTKRVSNCCICVNSCFVILLIVSLIGSAIVTLTLCYMFHGKLEDLNARVHALEESMDLSVEQRRAFVPYSNDRFRRDISSMRATQRRERQASIQPPSECTCPPGNNNLFFFNYFYYFFYRWLDGIHFRYVVLFVSFVVCRAHT